MNRRSIFKTALFGLLPKKVEAISPKVAGDFISPENILEVYGPITHKLFIEKYPSGTKVSDDALNFIGDLRGSRYIPSIVTELGITGKYTYLNETIYAKNGVYHSDNGPACIRPGGEYWYQYGRLHRVDGPAYKTEDNQEIREQWYLNGKIHRDNGPALIDDGYELWYKHGKLHRDDGPAVISKITGVEKYYTNGKFQKAIDTRTGRVFTKKQLDEYLKSTKEKTYNFSPKFGYWQREYEKINPYRKIWSSE